VTYIRAKGIQSKYKSIIFTFYDQVVSQIDSEQSLEWKCFLSFQ